MEKVERASNDQHVTWHTCMSLQGYIVSS